MTDDAVFIEAVDLLQPGFDFPHDDGLAFLALAQRYSQIRIESRFEQCADPFSDGRMFDVSRPHVVLRIWHAKLAQIARNGLHQRDLGPVEAGGQNKGVVAVVFGFAAHHRCETGIGETGIEPRLGATDVDRRPFASIKLHGMKPHMRPVMVAQLDIIGAFIDDDEAHVLKHGNALRKRNRAAVAPDLQAGARTVAPPPGSEIDAHREIG